MFCNNKIFFYFTLSVPEAHSSCLMGGNNSRKESQGYLFDRDQMAADQMVMGSVWQ